MKKNWKDILLAVLTALVAMLGGNEVDEYATAPEGYETEGERIHTDSGKYTITASFYELERVQVGNFPDVVIRDDIGVFTFEATGATPAIIEKTFSAEYPSYSGARLREVIEVVKPGQEGKAPEQGAPEQ